MWCIGKPDTRTAKRTKLHSQKSINATKERSWKKGGGGQKWLSSRGLLLGTITSWFPVIPRGKGISLGKALSRPRGCFPFFFSFFFVSTGLTRFWSAWYFFISCCSETTGLIGGSGFELWDLSRRSRPVINVSNLARDYHFKFSDFFFGCGLLLLDFKLVDQTKRSKESSFWIDRLFCD